VVVMERMREDIDSDEGKEGEELETVAIVEAQAIHNLQV